MGLSVMGQFYLESFCALQGYHDGTYYRHALREGNLPVKLAKDTGLPCGQKKGEM
jgi:hypothetical protein